MKYDYLRKHRLFDGPGPDEPEEIKKRIQELHDIYHPQAIFMTQTSATLFGWMIKEMYKTAWAGEKIPIIFTLNPRKVRKELPNARERGYLPPGGEDDKLKEEVKSKLNQRNVTGNVAIIDERSGFYAGEFEDPHHPVVFEPNFRAKWGEEGYWNPALTNPKTLAYSFQIVKEAMKERKSEGKVAVVGLGEQRVEGAPWYRKWSPDEVNEDYDQVHRVSRNERKGLEKEPAEVRDILHPKYAIKRYKELGKQLGEQIKKERESKKKGLEGTLGIISIAGFLFSILFLSGITGNVIGLTETKSIIGIISVLIGLIAGFFYLRMKKSNR